MSSWDTRMMNLKIFGWYSLLTQGAEPIHPSIKLIRVAENYRLFEVKRMIFIPVFFKAALSMQRESRFDYDLGCKF